MTMSRGLTLTNGMVGVHELKVKKYSKKQFLGRLLK